MKSNLMSKKSVFFSVHLNQTQHIRLNLWKMNLRKIKSNIKNILHLTQTRYSLLLRQPVPKLMLSTFQQTTLWLLVLKLSKMLLFLPAFLYLQVKKEFVKPESQLFPSVTTTLVTRQVKWLIKSLKRVLIPEKWLSRQTKIRQNFTTKKTATL